MNNFPDFDIGASMAETSLSSLPFSFDKRHYKKDSRFVNDLYTLTYDDHESLDSVRLFSSFANQVSPESLFPFTFWLLYRHGGFSWSVRSVFALSINLTE